MGEMVPQRGSFWFWSFLFPSQEAGRPAGGGCNLRPVAKRIGGRKSFIGFGALTGASYLSLPPLFMLPDADARYALAERQKRAGWGGILTLCVCCSSSPIAREEFGVVGPFFPPFLVQGHSHKTQQQRRKHLFLLRRSRQLKARKVLFFVFFLLLW